MRWDWPKQTILGFGVDDPNFKPGTKPVYGDCWRCCIAAILQVPADEVPHFVKFAEEQGRSADALTQTWLAKRGYWLIEGADHREAWQVFGVPAYSSESHLVPILPMMCCGPTVRSKNERMTHAVVMDGGKLLYDPHPSNAGLLAVTKRYIIVPHLPNVDFPKKRE